MQGNDIAPSTKLTYGCMFEGLLVTVEEVETGIIRKKTKTKWRINDLPFKSLIHLTTKMDVRVDVFTLMEEEVTEIEDFLNRRGAAVQVYPASDVFDLAQVLRYDRSIDTFFCTQQEWAPDLGIRTTVVLPDQTWGGA